MRDAALLGLFVVWLGLVLGLLRPLTRHGVRAMRGAIIRARGGNRPFTGYASILDGDTVVVARERIRLFGMDAPEMDQSGGEAARNHLRWLIAGRVVVVAPIERDHHGRIVARVTCAGTDLSRAMVRDGFARSMPFFGWDYVPSEIAARYRRCGLWAECRFTGIGDPRAHRREMRRTGRGRYGRNGRVPPASGRKF